MKICFVMHYPGYVRYFDSVFAALLERGHGLHIAFNGNWKQPEGLAGLPDHPNLTIDFEDFPTRRDSYFLHAKKVRGTTDYIRYLDWRFKNAPRLRARTEGALPKRMQFLKKVPSLPSSIVKLLRRGMVRYERKKIPSPQNVETYLADVAPDLLVVSPLVNVRSWQTDAVKAAQAIDIPTALCVASWDHLTTKGLIRVRPDKVFVWNYIQKREAWKLHDIKGSRVVVTGAQPFDKWFNRRPSTTRAAFLAKVGLPTDHLFVLFTGSTASISEPRREVDFVKRWIAKLRDSDGALKEIGVLIRPHPFNCELWKDTEIDDPAVTIFPKTGANPVDENDRADYFDSIYHSEAVLGINTSAMVEATILDRPVLSIVDGHFEATQGGTLHFQYLLPENGGFLEVARTLDEHIAQLEKVIADPESYRRRGAAFVDRFVRPFGREENATGRLVTGLEALAESKQGRQTGAAGAARARLSSEPTRVARPVDG